jgi:hypothetical protein
MTADGFETYFTERLWSLIPEVYRLPVDPTTESHNIALRALVRSLAHQFADSRRSIDRLWNDAFIETCDDWAVPLIARLVATRLAPAHDLRAQRVDVARTIHYRRRRGTPFLLEGLAREVSGWDVALVEAYRRLGRTHHRLDLVPRPQGLISRTPRGGLADLRSPLGAQLSHTPFDEVAHTPDLRPLRGTEGHYGLLDLNFHLYRLKAYEVTGSDPVKLTDPGIDTWTIDPSGRDIPLFGPGIPDHRPAVGATRRGESDTPLDPQSDPCRPLDPWEARGPIACRVLGHAEYELSSSDLAELLALPPSARPTGTEEAALFTLVGHRFRRGSMLARRLADFGVVDPASPSEPAWYRTMLTLALVPRSGKAMLYPRPDPLPPLSTQAYAVELSLPDAPTAFDQAHLVAGDLSARTLHPTPADGAITSILSPETGRFALTTPTGTEEPFVELYHYGFADDVGAGTYGRTTVEPDPTPQTGGGALGALSDGLTTIGDNRRYGLTVDATPRSSAIVQAADQRRPFVRLDDGASGGGAVLVPDGVAARDLTVDGLWLASASDDPTISEVRLEGSGAPPGSFDWDVVRIRHTTLDPGGERADGTTIPPLRLVIAGSVRRLVIERSILASITVEADAHVEKIRIRDSIVDAQHVGVPAIIFLQGVVDIARSTVIGDVHVEELHATDTLVLGEVVVTNDQAGCFRFSAAAATSHLPPSYRSWPEPGAPTGDTVRPWFLKSQRFGDPDYAVLSSAAPRAIRRGAENGDGMGSFNRALFERRLDSMRMKIDEFRPVYAHPQYPLNT